MRVWQVITLAGAALAVTSILTPAAEAQRGPGMRGGAEQHRDIDVDIYVNPRSAWSAHDAHRYRHGSHQRTHVRQTLHGHAVRRILRNEGFSNVHNIRLFERRGVIVANADGWAGRPILVRLDAYSGRIIDIERLGRHGSYYGYGKPAVRAGAGGWR